MSDTDSHRSINDMIRAAADDVARLVANSTVVLPAERPDAFRECKDTVIDYLEHNEAGVAFDHLVYTVGEADLPIGPNTYELISNAGALLGGTAKYVHLNPSQPPLDTLVDLQSVARSTYTVGVKRLDPAWKNAPCPRPFLGEFTTFLSGEDGQVLTDLVASLEPAEQMRCHSPKYSLVFWGPNHPNVEATFCFKCNNARTRIGASISGFPFDGQTPAARELLELLASFDPGEATT